MRTNIEIDDGLMAEAMKAIGSQTKRETVEAALRRLIQTQNQRQALKLRGKINWDGDLNEMRRD
ncbi:type II toxin-antitoxin system VapB family antitoxin [Sphingomonas sp.]|uniref:type II toxin-antitoxin system VapB family antitoxin n=1 Tax=Sphingomonas sp. TaxID=28214 RepID=UPI0035BC50D6